MKKFVVILYIFAILFNVSLSLFSFFVFEEYERGCWELLVAIMFGSCFANYYWMVKWMNRTKFWQNECEDYKNCYNDLQEDNTRLRKSLYAAQKYIPNRGKDGKFCKKAKIHFEDNEF